MKVGIVVRKGLRRREIELFSKFFDLLIYEIPAELPEVIEKPREVLKLPEDFKVDLIVSFANHPDINLELIPQAAKMGVKLIIITGGAKSGSYRQLKAEGERHGVKVLWEEICCATPKVEGLKFFEHFGAPEFEIELEGDIIKNVKVLKAAFCGATYFVAEKIKGLKIKDAPSKAGYFTQIFPCLASRGLEGGIHKAANAHKKAVERAIKKAKGN
ncbi:MAG: DUF166 family protein [Archaeoglobaceae archaeon]